MQRFTLVIALALGGCSGKSSDGSCVSAADCDGGEVCIDGACRIVCVEDSQCPPGWDCDDGVCEAAGSSSDHAPQITSIDGTGTVDGQDGRVGHRFTDRIVVTGEYLLGATAELVGPDPSATVYPLQACASVTDSQMVLGLPPSLVAGNYTLTVTNQAGGACTGLSILKGEDGEDGSLLNGDDLYVNVDGDVMTGDLSVSGQVAIWTSSSSASLAARATISQQLSGQVTCTGANAEITGVSTQFTTELEVGDAVEIEGTTYTVVTIANDTSMTVTPQPGAFLNVNAFTGGPILELQDLAGTTKVLVDRKGRLATPQLDILGDLNLTGAMGCTDCIDTTDVADGTLTNTDISGSAAIAASKINRAGLDADSVDGREPNVSLYSCPVSCRPSTSWSTNCPCYSAGRVSTTTTVSCTGERSYDYDSGTCYNFTTATCDCTTLLGYLMSP